MNLNGAELIIKLLEQQGIDTVAGIPGGANLPLYHALDASGIKHVLARHEQAAGFIAQGTARTTGKAAVCLATSGPGAVNLLTAIADAKLDSVPIIGITGQVPLSFIGTDAFQEIDTYGLTIPITKHNFLVRSPTELAEVIPRAFTIALSGRPGPVVIDVPKDVQTGRIELEALPAPGAPDPLPAPDEAACTRAARMIEKAERPVIYAGGGVISSDAAPALRDLAAAGDIPVVSTLLGLGAMPADDRRSLGMLGMHGSMATNEIVDRADLLIVCGARFDDRATGKVDTFAPRAAVIHIDVDSAEIGKIRSMGRADTGVMAGVGPTLECITGMLSRGKRDDWWKEIDTIRVERPELVSDDPMHPNNIIRALAALAPADVIVTTDVGQHQMWAAQAWPVRRPRSFLTSGGLGTMGFGVPAALGAALAHPDRTVVALTGDGSLLMNIQDLATLAEHDLDVKVVLFNNGHLGLVRQQQELFYEGRYTASRFEHRPDFCALARGFGIDAVHLESWDGRAAVRAFERRGPVLVEMMISETENVFPMVPPGAANTASIAGRRS